MNEREFQALTPAWVRTGQLELASLNYRIDLYGQDPAETQSLLSLRFRRDRLARMLTEYEAS